MAITAPTTMPAIAPAESVDIERGVVIESGVGIGVGVGVGVGVDGAVSTLESELLLTVEMTDDVGAGVVPM